MDNEIHELLTLLIAVAGTKQEAKARQRLFESADLLIGYPA